MLKLIDMGYSSFIIFCRAMLHAAVSYSFLGADNVEPCCFAVVVGR
jgi:hypothetical protein